MAAVFPYTESDWGVLSYKTARKLNRYFLLAVENMQIMRDKNYNAYMKILRPIMLEENCSLESHAFAQNKLETIAFALDAMERAGMRLYIQVPIPPPELE